MMTEQISINALASFKWLSSADGRSKFDAKYEVIMKTLIVGTSFDCAPAKAHSLFEWVLGIVFSQESNISRKQKT